MVLSSAALWIAFIIVWSREAMKSAPPISAKYGSQRRCPACGHTAPTENRGIFVVGGAGRMRTLKRCPGCRKLRLFILEHPEGRAPSPGSQQPAPTPTPTGGGHKSAESSRSRRVHQLLMWAALLVALLPGFPPLNRRWLPDGWAIPIVGLSLQVAFFLLALWAKAHLGGYWSGEVRIKRDHKLVRTGPYRVVRHPIYTAMLGMILATAIVSGEWHALAGVALMAIAYWRKVHIEEQHLSAAFGPDFDAYRRESWALVPGFF
jgi:protein-S-isoprenylcysteine O-methyltransferase Ste14